MTLPGVYLCMFMATAGVDGDGFALALPVPQEALERATMYINQRHVVVYMASAKAPAFDEHFAHGPVVRARGYAVAHGYVVSLLARNEPVELRDALQKRFDPEPSLVVRTDAEEAAPSTSELDAAKEVPTATSAPAKADAPTPKATTPIQSFPFGQQTPVQTPTSRWAFVCAIGLALCACAWAWAKKQRPTQGAKANIDVLAVRSLGSKHQLAVIDAGGERLLVCASNNGVTLLSHLSTGTVAPPNAQEGAVSFEDALRATDVDGLREMARNNYAQGSAQ